MKLPDFIIAGATRSGTSTLYEILKAHPDVFMPEKKELQFFYRDGLYEKGIACYADYFRGAKGLCGEASPPYFEKGYRLTTDKKIVFDKTIDPAIRMKKEMPDAKIVLTLRNPVNRAYSQYWKNVWQGREAAETFEDAIEDELSGNRIPEKNGLCWLYKNHYKIHLEHWLSLFPKEQIHVLILEEWTKQGLDSLQNFLELEKPLQKAESIPQTNTNRELRHSSLKPLAQKVSRFRFLNRILSKPVKAPPMKQDTRIKLNEIFKEDRSFIESHLGREIPWS